jgi:hypothetical protein
MSRIDAVDAGQSLIAELKSAIQSGAKDKRIDTPRRINGLLVAGSDRFSEQQIDTFDGVFRPLIKRTESKGLTKPGQCPGPINNAPLEVVIAGHSR